MCKYKAQQMLDELNTFLACITSKCHRCDLIGDISLTSATPCALHCLYFRFQGKKNVGFGSLVEFVVQLSHITGANNFTDPSPSLFFHLFLN